MSHRIDALVHGGMSAEEAAEVIGCPLDALVQHGNGYAVVVEQAPKAKRPKAAKPVEEAETGLDADENEGE